MSGQTPRAAASDLVAAVAATPAAQDLRRRLEAGGVLSLAGVTRAAQPFLAVLVTQLLPGRAVVLVADTLKSQESLHADLCTWCRSTLPDAPAPAFYPAWEILPHENKLPHSDVISERLEALVALDARTNPDRATTSPAQRFLVASVTAFLQRTFPPVELRQRTRRLACGDTLNPLDLIEWLEEQGYEPETQVSNKGELAWRGGIIDVWPLSSPWPARIEFFGDEIESIREFDPHNQLTRDTIPAVVLPPAGELGLLKKPANDAEATESAGASARPLATLLEYLPPDAILLLSDPDALMDHALKYRQQLAPDDPFFCPWDDVLAEAARRGMLCLQLQPDEPLQLEPAGADASLASADEAVLRGAPLPTGTTGVDSAPEAVLIFRSLDAFRPITSTLPEPQVAEAQRREFFAQMHRWLRQGHRVEVFCNNEGERQRFDEIWDEQGLGTGGSGHKTDRPAMRIGSLGRGFLCDTARLVVVTDAEIFGRYKVARPRRMKSAHAQSVRSAFEIDFTEFEEGDYVVHLQQGIGIYRGLKTLPAARARPGASPGAAAADGGQECLVIEYAPRESGDEPPRLYVPVSEAHLVSKYVGAGKARPQLSTIGGTRWTKAKEQAERAVKDLAGELLRVQAVRASQPGHAFQADSPWQREFESSFLYEETPDQLKAIDDAKRDMESPRPMDRLLCGDVGFGKTEVAIRAAFKAVMGGKQVALLVPTTVLAQQHYNNFRERMADYPVRIELLSRFRTAKQQRQVLEAAANGSVDIVIGTHRIVQADSQFKNLGLVIVDEEQKFGVKHKEQFKLLRQTVDVLTLSATPIPRTLYLALTGARDLSTLETPPQDRLPVETIVTNYDERIIRDAIVRELNRGGQTYFLHNRVSTIEGVALRLRALVPDARIVIGHGQMDDDELERVMTTFVNGEADVLVSTTIIESGLDIPNANTMIIDRADRFGLSDLYQLRGRVGRYKHQAYCYLLLPRHAQLLTEARKRMSAIKQYSALGSGFKIAMRDLEIRGAGNLLGAQQSGHITAVGFDLYCQLLARSVSVLKGEVPKVRIEVRTSLDFLAMNPGEETSPDAIAAQKSAARSKPKFNIEVPRETMTWSDLDDDGYESSGSSGSSRGRGRKQRSEAETDAGPSRRAPAYLPLDYVREPEQRVEVYRKLAQIVDRSGLESMKSELRDRFGPVPDAVDLLLTLGELRLLAAERGVTSLEVTEGKLKLMNRGELLTVGGQFPRLTKKEPRARLAEIKRLLLSLPSANR